ncbi:hypothetical protein HA402_003965 [Bradysia odoriphaga]|nr:hypothetical protein HA402_003965 [Bradysia odoriphaga]
MSPNYLFSAVQIERVEPSSDLGYDYVIENDLHDAVQTHEICVVNSKLILISQMSESVLIKAVVDSRGIIQRMGAFRIGKSTSMVHGLSLSNKFPGKVWVTLEADNIVVLIDPVNNSQSPPRIVREIMLPPSEKGPHYVGEFGNEICTTNKGTASVTCVNYLNQRDYTIYQGLPNPIFIAQHPVNQMLYSGEDNSNMIMKMNPKTKSVTQIPVTSTTGRTPVGMISGPKGVWFVLAGNSTQGTGTFGFIDENDNIVYYRLKSPIGENAALLHLAFDVNYRTTYTLYLLSTSLLNKDNPDALITVKFNSVWTEIVSESAKLIPTPHAMVHRIAATLTNIFVTELAKSKLASYVFDENN